MATVAQHKLASELSFLDIGKRIKGYHGARGLVSNKPIPTYNTIKEFRITASGVYVTVYRNRFESSETFYSLDNQVKLIFFEQTAKIADLRKGSHV